MATCVIEDKLAAWVAALDDVVAQAGGRVYPFGDIPQGTDWPFVSYFRLTSRRVRSLRGPIGVSHATVQIGCHGQTYRSAKRLADSIQIAMDAFGRGDMGGVFVQSMITGDRRDYGPSDEDLNPAHGDEVAQPCDSFDVTIWFQEG